MSKPVPQITVVIPVYNEEAIVASAAAELIAGLSARPWTFEILFAENGSRDQTPAILESLTRADERVRWFHCESPNYGAALRQGLFEARGEFVVCDEIDLCDLAFYDEALPMLMQGPADMVVGSKAARGASDRRPLIRRVATRVHNRMLRLTLGFEGTDTHGLKAFRREKLTPIVRQCVVDRDVFASELVIRAWRAGLNVVEIPVQLHEKRQPSIHLFRRVPNVLRNVAKLIYVIRLKGS